MQDFLIITAASKVYEKSLLALLGSLQVNWPGHPNLLVYDLGMSDSVVSVLQEAGIEIVSVPPFCSHWRKHFTWKIWCCNHVPAEAYLWLDAGVCVLRPMDEVIDQIVSMGYFLPGNGWNLKGLACPPLMEALGLEDDELSGLLSINGGIHGFMKSGKGKALLDEAMSLAFDEDNLKATEPLHRHDQAMLSLLAVKYFKFILHADGGIYAGSQGPFQVHGQKVWVHRQRMLAADSAYFIAHVVKPGSPYLPETPPWPPKPNWVKKCRIELAKLRGRAPKSDKAGESIYDGVRD